MTAAVPFTSADVAALRADFLKLMKNVDRVQDYATALRFAEAVAAYRAYLEDLIFTRLIGGTAWDPTADHLRAIVDARLGFDRARDWRNAQLTTRVEDEIAYWHRALRTGTWDFVMDLRVPLERIDEHRLRWRNTPQANRPIDPEQLFAASFGKRAPQWATKLKRAAPKAWTTLNTFLAWAGDAATVEVRHEVLAEIEGFQLKIVGDSPDARASVQALRAALRYYRHRAETMLPVLLRRAIPFEAILDSRVGFTYAGRYVGGPGGPHIDLNAWIVANHTVEANAHVIAHEMGHHLWAIYLSDAAREFWARAISADRGEIDLRDLREVWRQVERRGVRDVPTLSDLEAHLLAIDPVLYLQVQAYTHGFGAGGARGESLFFGLDELDAVIASGRTTLSVPNNPITAYAEKNTEEAFCEALGRVITYGPRAVLPLVLTWLSAILPELRPSAGRALQGHDRARDHG